MASALPRLMPIILTKTIRIVRDTTKSAENTPAHFPSFVIGNISSFLSIRKSL